MNLIFLNFIFSLGYLVRLVIFEFRCVSWAPGPTGPNVAKPRFFHHFGDLFFIDCQLFLAPFLGSMRHDALCFLHHFVRPSILGWILVYVLMFLLIPLPFSHTCFYHSEKHDF